MILRQSTAVDVIIGPFLDISDGATAETGESPSVKLSKNGQTLAAKNDATTPVHDADGYYNCELDATDTNTVGTLVLTVAASANALPVRHEFQVIEEATYDFLYAAGATPIADINAECDTAISDASLATAAALSTVDGNVDAILVDTGTTLPAQISGLNDPTAAAIADAVWDEPRSGHQTALTFGREITLGGGILVDTTITGTPTSTTIQLASGSTIDDFYNDQMLHITSGTGIGQARPISDYDGATKTITVDEPFVTTPAASDAIVIKSSHVHPLTAIADSIWDEAKAGHVAAGSFGEEVQAHALSTEVAALNDLSAAEVNAEVDTAISDAALATAAALATVDSNVDAILTDTADMQPKLGTPAGASMSADIAAVQADTDDIQTRIPAALVGGRMDANMGAISASATAADNLERGALALVLGAAAGTPTTTVIDTDLTETTNDHYVGRIITFVTGNIAGQSTDITGYDGTTKELTVTALTDAPSAGDTFVIS